MTKRVLHLGDYGKPLVGTIKDADGKIIDISMATNIVFLLKPSVSGMVTAKDGELYTDGLDGKVKYTLEDGDLSEIGTWFTQVKVTLPQEEWHTNIPSFEVEGNLEEVLEEEP